MSRFLSRSWIYCGIIRMHDYKTCEISLLLCSNSSVWSSKTSMLGLQTNLVSPPKETRTPENSHPSRRFKAGLLGKVHAWTFSQTPIRRGSSELPPPIPSNTTQFCSTSESSEAFFRPVDSFGRWTLLLFSKKGLGFVSYSAQVLYRKNSHFLRPHTSSGKRKFRKIGTGPGGGYSSGNQAPNSRSCRRQFEWYEETCQVQRMDSPALSFSFDSKIPNPASPTKTRFERRSHAGRDISINSSSSRGSQWVATKQFNRSINSTRQKSLYHVSNPGNGERIPSVYKLLSSVQNLSGTRSAIYNQYHRIDEFHHPRFIATKPFGFQPSIALTMGHSIDSITKEIKLQRQTSSTDLINPTPFCDCHSPCVQKIQGTLYIIQTRTTPCLFCTQGE